MSDRSATPSSEGEGEDLRPDGHLHDSSEEESEDDLEEFREVAEGFIVDDEEADGDAPAGEDDEAARRRRKKEARRRKKRREMGPQREPEVDGELSEDELELLQENQRLAGPSRQRPPKRQRQDSEEDEGEGRQTTLLDMFNEDNERRALEDEDDDDLGDFIEEDDDEDAVQGETEEQRRERKREEKLKRREAARVGPEAAGLDRAAFEESIEVFGDGQEYDWAMDLEDLEDEEAEREKKKDLRLEDVFDPAEIKARRLLDEDKAIAQRDRPERHQLVNSTLSDISVLAPDSLFPPPDIAAGWAFKLISKRTQYLFCNMHSDDSWPEPTRENPSPYPTPRRTDLMSTFVQTVSAALHMMFVDGWEVPYLWHYKRDSFSILEEHGRTNVQFLDRDELWQLYTLGAKYQAISTRTNQTNTTWNRMKARRPGLEDAYFEERLLPSVCMASLEAAADGYEWLTYRFAEDMRQLKEEESNEEGFKRLPERPSGDVDRNGPIKGLVEAFGISVPHVATVFNETHGNPDPPKNASKLPIELAAEYSGANTYFLEPSDALTAARNIIITEFAKDPSIRQQARDFFDLCGTVTINPTDRGMTVIDEYHLYRTFEFVTGKPLAQFRSSPQFLHMLKAEEEGLVQMVIEAPADPMEAFTGSLSRCVRSNDHGEISTAWNEQRAEVIHTLIDEHLIPMAEKWAREHLRSLAEEYVAETCRMELEFRISVRPFSTPDMEQGETPSVLALTSGRGDYKDAIMAIFLDSDGSIRTQTKFDNLRDKEDAEADRKAFLELFKKDPPKVVVVGGLSIQAGKVRDDVSAILRAKATVELGEHPPDRDAFASNDEYMYMSTDYESRLKQHLTPLIFVNDATAKFYMSSEEAEREFPTMPLNGRLALGLARYTQNPLNAYCKLGRSIADVSFVDYHQKLIPNEKLLKHLERGLVNATCAMGIEINSCINDSYQRAMLPFVAGLGPRKADALVNAVLQHGQILNRLTLADLNMFGPTVLENISGFLSIDTDLRDFMLDPSNPQDQPDPLDLTRIHPNDYEFAQKMCQDALDLDAEDVADQHKSAVVLQLLMDEDREKKLADLNLDEFSYNLQKSGEGNRRHTLGEIVAELSSYRADRRPAFYVPTDWEVIKMLTGETERTIGPGLKVTATVRRALANRVFCQLECGMDALLEREYVDDNYEAVTSCEDRFSPKESIRAMVIKDEPSRFQVRISTRRSDMDQAVPFVQPFVVDPFWDARRQYQAERDAAEKKKTRTSKVKRVITHPNWHIMNAGQAERFLANGQRGDVVVRPSSKGPNHLAITWKVADGVFQHIDVEEQQKPNEYTIGQVLRVSEAASYRELDELIIMHIREIAKKFDEIERHEKFKPEDELEGTLKNYVLAHPGRSAYGFTIDSEHPGYIKLCFLNRSTALGGIFQTWPVKVLPGAYRLGGADLPGVTELCNAFKTQYAARLQDQGGGGKTPGIRAGRTPMGGRTPGGRTPAVGGFGGATPMYGAGATGRTPVRPGMTPNPYNMQGQTAYANGGNPGYGRPAPGYPGQGNGYPQGGMRPPNGMPPAGYPVNGGGPGGRY